MKTTPLGMAVLAIAMVGSLIGHIQQARGAETNGFTPVNLISDMPGVARHTDPLLVNPWGMAISPHGHIFVADAEMGVVTVYMPGGITCDVVIQIPPSEPVQEPTGVA